MPAVSDAPPTFASRVLGSRTLLFDLATSYLLSVVRAGSMFAIVALLSRRTSAGHVAAFLFLRAMLAVLNNLFAGVQPAAIAALRSAPAPEPEALAGPIEQEQIQALHQSRDAAALPPKPIEPSDRERAFALRLAAMAAAAVFAVVVGLATAPLAAATHPLLPAADASAIASFILAFGLGQLARNGCDAASGMLQLRGLLWLDNLLVSAAEAMWVAIAFEYVAWSSSTAVAGDASHAATFSVVGRSYLLSGVVLFILRWGCGGAAYVRRQPRGVGRSAIRWDVAQRFLSVSGVLALASLGDFLYAGSNNLIINRFLDPLLAADYGQALQVDSVLLLAVAALASVLLPRAALLHERGDVAGLRRAYLTATFVGTLLLAGGAGLFLVFQRQLLTWWLGDAPPRTMAILPLVLCHTVIGGTGGVARSVMLGIGRFRAFTIISIGCGALNAVLGAIFVLGFGLGLRSLVCATIISVALRVAVLMPWYILRTLREKQG